MNSQDDLEIPERLLGIWAHPDDEAYLCSGLMARVIKAGGSVTVITASYGEQGFPDTDTRSTIDRAALRMNEMIEAMAEIGVEDVRFFGWPDGGLDTKDLHTASDSIAAVIEEVQPDTTVTFGPDGMTGHPDHIAISQMATHAWAATGIGSLLFATHKSSWIEEHRDINEQLGVWMSDEPKGVENEQIVLEAQLNPTELDTKRRVLACHQSQTEGLAKAMGERTYRHWSSGEYFRFPSSSDLFDMVGHLGRPQQAQISNAMAQIGS